MHVKVDGSWTVGVEKKSQLPLGLGSWQTGVALTEPLGSMKPVTSDGSSTSSHPEIGPVETSDEEREREREDNE